MSTKVTNKAPEITRTPVARIDIKPKTDAVAPKDLSQSPVADQVKSRQLAKLPDNIGKKIADNRILNEPQAQAPRFKLQLQLSPELRQRLTGAYQKLVRDPYVRQMRGSQVSEFIERRFTEISRGERHLPRVPLDVLKRLFNMRHQVKEPGEMRLALRYELQKLKEERKLEKERVGAAEGSKEEAARGSREGIDADAQVAREAFLKRSSHVIKNLNVEDSESPFEALLKKVLKGNESAPQLVEGKKANFKGKSDEDWRQFFKNVLSQGSQEANSTQKGENIMEAFYRGLFRNLSSQKGMTLVTDLKLATEDNKELQEKFVRIAVENPQVLEKISQLKPGDDLPKEWLRLLGESVEYTKMVNKPDIPGAQTGEQLLQQLRQQMNPSVTSRLEQQLIQERRERWQEAQNRKEEAAKFGWSAEEDESPTQPSFYLGRDLEGRRDLKPGRAKFGLFFAYLLATSVMMLIFYIIFRASF